MKEKSTNISIKNWHEKDRPREKFLNIGKDVLSDAELLAILLGSGNRNESAVQLSQKILRSVSNNLNELGKLSVTELMQFNGIGEAKAVAVAASLELGRRRRKEKVMDRKKITSSAIAYEYFYPIIGELPHEEFWIVYLNNSNKVIQSIQLSKGGITGTLVDIRLALRHALEMRATSLILAHNHPSGNLNPSKSDKQLTLKLKNACESLDIKVLDHIIVAEKSYFSFADEDLL
ncbi:DNA repair protein RadC [Leptobacterium flavescens]|uniref:DNA repair protein RadC n=1 Tax=Leptobacterium flavescens TaxID=472055 RepID=A0A6P0UPQ5_9FLAO|nr:DNA repair protein RadC [Leptobacterium flavescens]NER15145.1 DNA repair protein RadC [Leptobacterium flavescens]